MTHLRLIWPPAPYLGGFCITDDTDAAEMTSVRIVYDLLRSLNLRTTKTVWAFPPQERCGIPPTPDSTLRGITLGDPDYLDYCRELARDGFEIALHGASAGNNRRERTAEAFELLGREFGRLRPDENGGGYRGTYICHSKNADNIYWEEKVAPNGILRRLLKVYSHHKAFGEVENTPYFWGDICRDNVSWIRLFRTRERNTLAVNPSMPYYEASKPYVRGWFAATKRNFHDCTTSEALDRLSAEHGLTVLYQYLHRYADTANGTPFPEFRADAERLAADSRIYVDSVGAVMGRLRALQGIFVGFRQNEAILFNAGTDPVRHVQLSVEGPGRLLEAQESEEDPAVEQHGHFIRIRRLDPGRRLHVSLSESVQATGRNAFRLDAAGHGHVDFGHGRFYANVGDREWHKEGRRIAPGSFETVFEPGLAEVAPMSRAGSAELTRLFFGQMRIIARELFLRQRHLNADAFLGADHRPLEDHANW